MRRYVAAGGWTPYRTPDWPSALAGLDDWLAERLRRHRGNAGVVRQDLERERGVKVSLRTIQRVVSPHRRELAAETRTVRFETPPGHQLQVDFGELRTPVDGESGRVYLFVATLAYSRRPYVRVKCNAIAGHRFGSWAAMEAHLARWTREIADVRIHGTTGEAPLERFARAEAAVQPLLGARPPFRQSRELTRVVQADGCVELDTNRYEPCPGG